MPLKNTGKVISSVRYYKDKVVISFGKEKISIPNNIASDFYLYKGKELSNKDVKEIKDSSGRYNYLKYAYRLINKKAYTEYHLREKLYLKEATKADVDYVIKKLKDNHLIDDNNYIASFVEEASNRGYGKHKIIQKLNEKGIFVVNIENLNFSEKDELAKAKKLLPSLERKYDRYSFNKKKEHVYIALVQKGFEISIAQEIGDLIQYDEDKEINNCKNEYLKLTKLQEEDVDKALYKKGFKKETINKVKGI